eukprot:351638-Chlamydomonas_euryale.AAC.2
MVASCPLPAALATQMLAARGFITECRWAAVLAMSSPPRTPLPLNAKTSRLHSGPPLRGGSGASPNVDSVAMWKRRVEDSPGLQPKAHAQH